MKKLVYKIMFMLTVLVCSTSCEKEMALDVDVRDFNPDNYVPGPFDDWLTTEFLDTYNIEVVYRWRRELAPIGKDMVPPREDRVQAAMEAVRDTWLVPYLQIAGKNFIKPLAPKQIVLHGSEEYNDNGTITLGTADGGRRVVLNVINRFDKANRTATKRMMRTVHHEFTHIINQMVLIPADYQEISRGGYLANWTNEGDTEAQELGFVSRYARMNEMEDFAEMVAHLLVEGQIWFDNWVASSPTVGAERLRLKEQAVRDYFLLNFEIDFAELQLAVANSFDEVSPVTPLGDLLRSAGVGGITDINPHNQTHPSSAFTAIWDATMSALNADGGRSLGAIALEFDSQGELTIRFDYANSAGSNFIGRVDMDMVVDDDGTTTFAVASPQRGSGSAHNNYNGRRNAFAPFVDFLTENTFRADWMNSVYPGSAGIFGGFFLANDPSLYFYGGVN